MDIKDKSWENRTKSIVGLLKDCSYPFDITEDTIDGNYYIYGITIRGEQLNYIVNGQKIKACGFDIHTNTFGQQVLSLETPVFGTFDLVECYRLELDISMITSFDVEVLTVNGKEL